MGLLGRLFGKADYGHLAKLQIEKNVHGLSRCLNSRNRYMRNQAAETLGHIGDPGAVTATVSERLLLHFADVATRPLSPILRVFMSLYRVQRQSLSSGS